MVEQLVYADEDYILQDKIVSKENEFNQKCVPPLWLSDAETPFKWLMSIPKTSVFFNRDIFVRNDHCKLEDGDSDNNFIRFNSLLTLLTMKSLNWYQNLENDSQESEENYKEALKKEYYLSDKDIDYDEYKLENVYSSCQSILEALMGDEEFKKIGTALEHVLLATRAQILYTNGNIGESVKVAQDLHPVEEMTPENKAAIKGAKVQFMFNICIDNQKILELLRQVVKMDPNFGAWSFLSGILTRRLRKELKGGNDYLEEIKLFERAYELHPCLKHLLFVAQAYQEVSCWIAMKNISFPSDSIKDMQNKSVELFRQCWSMRNNTAAIARRVGNSLMKIRYGSTDRALAKEALLKAVELQPNIRTFHALGRFYYRLEKNDEKALECFEKAGSVFGGTGEIVRLKLIRDPLYDPYDIVQEWIQVVETQVKPDSLYCDIGFYYIFFHGDLKTSVKYFWKVFKKNFNSPHLVEFSSYVFCVHKSLNIINLLVNEILLLKKENEALPPEKQKDIEFLNSFLAKVMEKYPELSELQPCPSLLFDIRRDIKNGLEASRNKRYGFTVKTTTCKEEERSVYKRYNRFHSKSESLCYSDTVNRRNDRETMKSDGMNKRDDERNRKESKSNQSYNRSGSFKEQRSYNKERYDVTVTDWRAESRNNQKKNQKRADPEKNLTG